MNIDLLESSEDDSDVEFERWKKIYRPRINFDLEEFSPRFRFSKTAIENIIRVIGPDLQHETNNNFALSPNQQLLLALRYLTGGGFMITVGDAHGPSKATVCRAVRRVVTAINQNYFENTIDFPENADRTAAAFYKRGKMPCVVGTVDGTHVVIKKPTVDENQYVNRHQSHSINVMAVCGPDYRFYYINSRFPGSVADARVLRRSALAGRFDAGWRPIPNAIILGDSGYGLSEWLITPILNDHTIAEKRFNRSHRKIRNVIECAFGILKRRWACLNYLRLDPVYAAEVVKVCFILHNLSAADAPITEEEVREVQLINHQHGYELLGDNRLEEENVEANDLGQQRRLQLVQHFT